MAKLDSICARNIYKLSFRAFARKYLYLPILDSNSLSLGGRGGGGCGLRKQWESPINSLPKIHGRGWEVGEDASRSRGRKGNNPINE